MKNKIQHIITALALTLGVSYTATAQVTAQKIGANPTTITPSAVLDIESTNKGVLFPRVTLTSTTDVATIASPATGLTVYNTASAGTAPNNVTPGYYFWNGTKWTKLAVETPPVAFAKTVYVNAVSPTSATIFDENNPPAANDDALKADDANLYIGSDGSTWTYDPTGTGSYKTYAVAPSTPFYLAATTTDAGNDKEANIWRRGSIGIGTNNPSTTLHVQNPLAATNSVNANAQVLRLSRPATGGVKEDNFAQFNLGSYENTGTSSFQAKSRLDLALKDGVGTASTNVMTWNANGRVGISTTSPQTLIDVSPATGSSSITVGTAGTGTTEEVALNLATKYDRTNALATSANRGWQIGARGNAFSGSPSTFHASYWNGTGYLQYLTILPNGNVGLNGVPNPQQALDLSGTALFRINNNSVPHIQLGFSNPHQIRSRHSGTASASNAIDFNVWRAAPDNAPKQVLTLQGDGNVGIGTNAPTAALDVNSATVATATVNADVSMLKLVRPTATSSKIGNVAQFNMGSYNVLGTTAYTRLDLNLNDGLDVTNLSNVMTWQANGNVGIGTTAPASKLEVDGAVTNKAAFNAGSSTTIDFTKSNLAYTTASAGNFTLTGLKDGGTYTLAVQGTVAGTASFTASSFTFRSPNNGLTTSGLQTLYTFMVMGTTVYFYMTTGL